MLNNPILPTLNQEDINQRFSETWVDYNKELLYVRSILGGRHPTASVCNKEQVEYVIDPWKWELMDTRRPKAGWYTYNDYHGNPVVFFFRLSNRKQFHRGLNEDNTVIWYPYPDGQGSVNMFDNLRVALDSKPIPKKKMTSAELVKLLSQPDKCYQILQRYLCATRSRFIRKGIDLYYRSEMIAQWNDDKWFMVNPNFVDEVKESIIDFNYKGMDEDKNLMEYLPNEEDHAKAKLKALKEKLAKPMPPAGRIQGGGGGGGILDWANMPARELIPRENAAQWLVFDEFERGDEP